MPIIRPSPAGKRGEKDARRHRQKQRESIKKNLPDIISDESIITGKKGKKIKVPIRGIVIPDFRPGKRRQDDGEGQGGGTGVGQGNGQPGDVIGKKPGQGSEPGGAGEEPGEDYIETEIDIAELIEMMFEDLGLPNLKKKELAELEVVLGHQISGVRKSGPAVLMNTNKTAREAMGRFFAFLETLKSQTGKDELVCYTALKQTGGDLGGALKLLEDPEFRATENEVVPFPIVHEEDLRYHDIKEKIAHESNAVIFMLLDVSGSMSTMKKYLARSMMFWLTEFLRKLYDNVEVRFIIYHSTAKLVDEHTAFHTMESGGTKTHTAYELARSTIETEYPTDSWNVYAFHFSDGDDFDPARSVGEARKLIEELAINMLGYVEIHAGSHWMSLKLLEEFLKQMPIDEENDSEDLVLLGKEEYPFVGAIIEDRDDIWPIIQEFLKKGRW